MESLPDSPSPSSLRVIDSKSDSYEEQLRSLFLSCCPEDDHSLENERALISLCTKLQLTQTQITSLLDLLPLEETTPITFEVFRDVLVSYLEERKEDFPQMNGLNAESGNNNKDLDHPNESLMMKGDRSLNETTFKNSISSLESPPRYHRVEDQQVDSTEEEYLRSIWAKLGVGQDGFLDRNELSIVCQCIGMEKLPDEVVDQLFLRLDLDNDGRVAFNDLLSIFQSSKAFWHSSSSSAPTTAVFKLPSTDSTQETGPSSTPRSRRCTSRSSPINESLKKPKEIQYFSAIGSESGSCSYEALLEYWDTIGILNGSAILRDLGLLTSYSTSTSSSSSSPGSNHHFSSRIDLFYLSALLESEMEQCKDLVTYPGARAAITSVQREAGFVRSSLDNVRLERDKLRTDLNDANQRASLLAQEIDDQNARVERNSRLQIEQLENRLTGEIKEIQSLLSKEREQSQCLARELELKDKFHHEKSLEHEGKLKEEISLLLSENERLERENLALGVKLKESDSIASSLQKEIQSLTDMKERLLELENQVSNTEQIKQLLREIEELKTLNKDLKDQNDELYSQLETSKCESFEHRDYSSSSSSSTVSESIGAEILGCPPSLNLRRKGSSSFESLEDQFLLRQEIDSSGASSSDEGFIVSSLKKRVRDLENKCKRQSQSSEKQYAQKLEDLIKNYENELSSLKESNMKLMNEKVNLEEFQLRTKSINITLTNEMEKVDSEMTNVQNRLHVALGTLDVCKDKQSNDEERINILTAKCSKLEDRLRESLSLPPSSLSGPPSSSASSENIQIISIRNSVVHSDSAATSPSPSIRGSTASPNISKIFLNSSESRLGESEDSSSNCSPVSKRPLRRSSDFLSSSTSSPSFFRQIQNHFKSNNATSSSNSNTIKRSRSTSENETRSKVQVFQLEQHCKNLEGELDTVKDEILKILSAKSSANKENESLKRYARAYESLVRENQSLKKEIHELRSKCGNGLSSTSPLPPQIHHDRSSPDGQEYYDSPKSPRVSSTDDDEGEDSLDKRDLAKLLETQKSELETERKGLLSKNSELEESLELMKTEFESMEDYWQEKLDKERSFYENQLSLSDSNFKELEIKMKEYEELMMTTEGMAHQDSDKLSTIAESVSLECQVTELEEELSDVRGRLKEVEGQKNQEINEISQAWKHKFEADYNIHLKEKEIYETKIRQMEKTLEDVSSNLTKATSERISEKERYDRDICILQDSCHQMQEQIRRSKSVSPVPPALKLRLIEANESGTNKEKLSVSDRQSNCNNQNCCQHSIPPSWLIHPPATGLPRYCNHSGSMSLDASFRYSDQSNSSSKQSNSMSHISDDVVDSVARAYQTMVRDISNEKNSILKELENLKIRSSNKKDPVAASVARIWKSRIQHQEQRCQQLRSSLLQQQTQYKKILKATRDQHHEAIKNLENLMAANENVLKTHAVKYGEQIDRLTQSELLVKSLVAENDSLVSAFQSLSKNHLNHSNNPFITTSSNNKFNLIKSFSVAITSSSSSNNSSNNISEE